MAVLTEMEKRINTTPVEELTYSELRRVKQSFIRRKDIKLLASDFEMSVEKAEQILNRFDNRFNSEEERDAKVKEMYLAGCSNAAIKDECCIISDHTLYAIYDKYNLPKRKKEVSKKLKIEITDEHVEKVVEAYGRSKVKSINSIYKLSGLSLVVTRRALEEAVRRGLINTDKN